MAANPTEENFDQTEFDEDDLGEVQIESTAGRKRLFSKELRCMMYGFGDDQNPYTESVDLLEDLVIEFITEMTHRAMEIGRTGRVQVDLTSYRLRHCVSFILFSNNTETIMHFQLLYQL
ncbi:transcription initiation factor TFIID subunit 13-like [Uranotaenia lowii]|uniref:transcription initiation factor TFIID subunit 13-like n=1 Tax=Uranotaenia lowii TaxID=190385 RepID=UPI002478FED8|nr:transcription initiation factor TFIID subunit 13-like [Uranotaenia lowii]